MPKPRRPLSSIAVRLLLFNLLLVFLPAAGVLYLDAYERHLLAAQEAAMVQQGRLLAAVLADHGELESSQVQPIFLRLSRRLDARLRVVDRNGRLLADSRQAPAPPAARPPALRRPFPAARDTEAYRGAAALYRLYQWLFVPAEPAREPAALYDPARPLLGPEIRAALAGRYGSATRASGGGQRSLTLYSAVPVRSGSEVVGAVLVSQSTFRILRALYSVRLGIFRVVLASLAAALALTLLTAVTIAHPLRRLRDEANALLDHRGRLLATFRGSRRRDEIGDLARALERLTHRLEDHQRSLEGLAAELSHEFRNPLAAIRTATELLGDLGGGGEADRERFLSMIEREVTRLERLLSGVRELAALDREPAPEAVTPVALNALCREVAESLSLRQDDAIEIELLNEPLWIDAAPERITQALENVLDNAVGFSPPGSRVTLTLVRSDGPRPEAKVIVDDRGPGIPESHLDRIFDRFFTYRPGESNPHDRHAGLGLAIARAIVASYGGSISAANRPEGGARFTLRLPIRRPGG